MFVEYSSNNSGGGWWLEDHHWQALEAAGWHVEWGGQYFCNQKYGWQPRPAALKQECDPNSKYDCPGHVVYQSLAEVLEAEKASKGKLGRWLGAAATSAWIEAEDVECAIASWERATCLDSTDEGCSCCGEPHSFHEMWKTPGTLTEKYVPPTTKKVAKTATKSTKKTAKKAAK